MSGAKDYLDLMRGHCDAVRRKMRGKTLADWGGDENLRDAVCLRLMALAENVKEYLKVRPELGADYPAIPWRDIVKFRERIAHHYEGIDYDVVWEIVEADIPVLSAVIDRLAGNREASSGAGPEGV